MHSICVCADSYMMNYLIFQGNEMAPTWGIESNVLNSAINPICIVGFGLLLDNVVLPALRRRGTEPSHMNKMIFGCACGVAAMLWQVLLESMIKSSWTVDRSEGTSIFAQVPCYALIGLGEIFVNPVGAELSFRLAPQEFKGLAMGVSVFMVGGVPGFLSGALASTTKHWQRDSGGCESRFDAHCGSGLVTSTGVSVWDYPTTNMQNLYWVAAALAVTGMVLIQFVGKPLHRMLLHSEEAEARSKDAQE